jgi:4-amino-4-deoxy-L-arabinose transferase-like glycosyltransferase
MMSSRYPRFQPFACHRPCCRPVSNLVRLPFQIALCVAVVAGLTVLRGIFATTIELRVDEAYYWTWSKEGVMSFLDHPPLIAWLIRLSTALFGDTNLGVRFPGLFSMLVMQTLLADIAWRTLRDWRYVVAVVLMTEAAPDYGLLMAKLAPDTVLIPCDLIMVWSLVRLTQSGDQRWWLPAGLFQRIGAYGQGHGLETCVLPATR